MKTRKSPGLWLTIAAVTVTCLFARDVMAQIGSSDAATIQNVAPTAAPAQNAPVQLSYGVVQILRLSQAKVNDDTIVNYIRNSGSSYGMDAGQIIYLKQQGVSETVINAMINQPRLTTTVTPAASQPAATAVAQPTATYVQPTATYVPSSTVYVVPDTQSYQYQAWYDYYHPYYGYYPYYSGWYYPSVTFSFGYGGGWHGGYYHGGWNGGYRGGWHGGGGWHR